MATLSFTKFNKAVQKFLDDYTKEVLTKVIEVSKVDLTEEQRCAIEGECKVMYEEKSSGVGKKKGGGEKVKRAPTKYNLFIKDKIVELKNSNPEIDRKELMKMAAQSWSKEKEKVQAAAVKEEPVKAEPVKAEPVKAEPAKKQKK